MLISRKKWLRGHTKSGRWSHSTMSRVSGDRLHTTRNKHELIYLNNNSPDESPLSRTCDLEKIGQSLMSIKANKAPGFVRIHNEFLTNSGPCTRTRLADLFSDILKTGTVPKEFKKTIIGILKSGQNEKPAQKATDQFHL